MRRTARTARTSRTGRTRGAPAVVAGTVLASVLGLSAAVGLSLSGSAASAGDGSAHPAHHTVHTAVQSWS